MFASPAHAVSQATRAALFTFFNSTGGPNWTHQDNWLGPAGSECSWYGISCDANQTHVLAISLPNNKLQGNFVPALTAADGFDQLQALDLSSNGGLASAMPPDISTLSNLQYLDFGEDLMIGPFPDLSKFPKLQQANLSHNRFTGSVSDSKLQGLSVLTDLLIGGNRLTGKLPTLKTLTNLKSFDAHGNLFAGQIPDLPSALQFLDLSVNQLSGTLPALPQGMSSLNVENNQITGQIPGTLPNLQKFRVAANAFHPSLTANVPATLLPTASSLCPNAFWGFASSGWDAATGHVPWYGPTNNCDADPWGYAVGVDDLIVVRPGGSTKRLSRGTTSVLANDHLKPPVTFVHSFSPPLHGSVDFNNDGTFVYRNTSGTTDDFSYTFNDAVNGGSANVSVVVVDDNPPMAADDALTVGFPPASATVLVSGAGSVLANDRDFDGDTLFASVARLPQFGSLVLNADGTFQYSPAFSGDLFDSFVYSVCDTSSACSMATVTIHEMASPPPNADKVPLAIDDALQVAKNQPTSVLIGGGTKLSGNDVDPDNDALTTIKLTDPVNGTVSINANGTFTYTNNYPSATEDSFMYEACDPSGECSPATVWVTIGDNFVPDNLPVAANDDVIAPKSQSVAVTSNGEASLLANDSDQDVPPDTLTASKLTDPLHGIAKVGADGTFEYTNTDPAATEDSFLYEACDSFKACVSAQVHISITDPPDLTVAKSHVGDFEQGQSGAEYTIAVTNAGTGPTTGALITLTDTLPAGLTATAIDAGPSWSCTLNPLECKHIGSMSAGSSDIIVLTVDVAIDADSVVTNTATVAGGGELNLLNDAADDVTSITQLNTPVADLTVTKSHVGNFTQGQIGATYTLVGHNVGTAAATGPVTITDTLPAGLVATGISGGSAWHCTLVPLSCNRTDGVFIANYAPITVTVNVTGPPGNVTNTATISGGGESNTSNDTATDPTTILGGSSAPDLVLAKTHAGNFSQGQKGAVYKLVVTNVGNTPTSGQVSVVDALPPGLTLSGISGPNWNCTPATATCSRSDMLDPGASYEAITLSVDVANNAGNNVTNTATVSGGGESNTANDTASDPTVIDGFSNTSPDLTLTKTHAGNFSQHQTNATYSLVVSNMGGVATNGSTVSVVDVLPPSMTVMSMTGTGWTCTANSRTCTRTGVLQPNASYPAISLVVSIADNAPSNVTNTATVSGGGEANTNNDSASDPTTIDAYSDTSADLTLTKTHAGNFSQGQKGAVYKLVVSNAGGGATSGETTVVDTLPADLTLVDMSGPNWNCTPNTRTCKRTDPLNAGGSYEAITVTVDVVSNAHDLTNVATVAGGGETNTNNDLAADPTTVDAASLGPDLALTKSHAGDFAQGQSGAIYTLSVHNVGGAPTAGLVTVTDTLPPGLTAASIVGGATWACTTNPLQCTTSAPLANGLSYPDITLTVNVAIGASSSVTNNASVGGGGETNTANDAASDPTTITQGGGSPPDLTIAKSHVGNFGRGETAAAYTLTVHNAGATPTTGVVTVADTLPQGLSIHGAEGTGWTCVQATCTRSDALVANASYPDITLTVDVAASASSNLANTATVSGGGETNTANDTATDPTAIVSPAGNHAPLGVGDAVEVPAGDAASDIVGDSHVVDSVLDNDYDSDPNTILHAVKLTEPAHGTVNLHADGTFVYTNTSDVPTDSFTYKACDLFSCSAPTLVTITIGDGLHNHAPFAVGDAVEVAPNGTSDVIVGDSSVPSSVLDNDIDVDGDSLTATKLSEPSHGTATLAANGMLSYQNTPNDPATSDGFMYAVCDVHGSCDLAAVTITIGIGLADHKPVVVDDAIQVAPGQSANTLIGDLNVPGSVLDNDADPDGDALSVMKISDLLNASGTLMLDALGFVAYDNDPANPATSDTALYSACDPSGACTAGLVTVSIKSGALDHAPTAEDDAIHIGAYGMATSLVGGATSLVANDTDLDPGETQTLTAHLIMAPEHGRMTINPNGTFVYVNDDPASGADVIQYEACDSEGACDAATVNVVIDTTSPTVTCVLPRQLDVVGDTVSLDLALLFAPPANDSLTYSVANAPPTLSIVGSLLSGTLTASGTFTSTLQAQAVTGGGVASQDVAFQVLAPDDLLLRNGFDIDNPNSICQ